MVADGRKPPILTVTEISLLLVFFLKSTFVCSVIDPNKRYALSAFSKFSALREAPSEVFRRDGFARRGEKAYWSTAQERLD